jgi:hypothetical protein
MLSSLIWVSNAEQSYPYTEKMQCHDPYTSLLLVLVEKKSEYKLGDVGDTLEHLRWLEEVQVQMFYKHGV